MLKRQIAQGRFIGDMEEHLYPVEIGTGDLLFFCSPQAWNRPAQNSHSYSTQNAFI